LKLETTDNAPLPKPAGRTYLGPSVDARGFVQKQPLNVTTATESLAVMTDEYHFFSPAILYLHARFTDAPLIDLMYEQQRDIKVYYRLFQREVFRGLEAPSNGNRDWNHALWAVKWDDWQTLSDFLVSLTFFSRVGRRAMRVAEQKICIIDPLRIDRGVLSASTESLIVTVFGLRGNLGTLAMQPGKGQPPELTLFPADPEMAVYLAALMQEDDNVEEVLNFSAQKANSTDTPS
jgi:hypothetical protein